MTLTRRLVLTAGLFAAIAFSSPQASFADDKENTLFLDTQYGRAVIKLRPDLAPNHVKRIKTLTRQGFYNGLKFHRVIDGFMAQTGDPRGNGTGGSSLPNLKAEFSVRPFERGVVGMARSNSRNSANSQFFIMFDDASWLNKQYTVWGEVVEGMEFIDRLKKGEPPAEPDIIIKMQVASDSKLSVLSRKPC